ncbi:aldose 1-epimerase [Snuella sedimenti]|uniref:Aldose 1-epimerase n=1 Tax=Snuella sedimenti TaxID=2798802 RepID=A0A8J7IRI2_9FLAO|nr:aldose 1-epimerase [Snuella sedimenti]MBJ6369837.1 aldose 1-epimerase [Snuella sedimenti]
MYKISHTQKLDDNVDYIEVENSEKTVYAKIFLNLGASLQELILNGHHLIKDLHPLTYEDTYASSILFPFANRIKDGAYTFQGKSYAFKINEKPLNNALHGLVYNKTFKLVKQHVTQNGAEVILLYTEADRVNGFPYKYTIQLTYSLSKDGLGLKISVKNEDIKPFPFTLGWHPYFLSDNLYESTLNFDADKTCVFDERNITIGLKDIAKNEVFKVEDKSLDDCFVLNTNKIVFNTPKYKFTVISSSDKGNFLQLYTPPHANTIAIEPTTGVSDSFNNGMGLQTLQPKQIYNISWDLKIE